MKYSINCTQGSKLLWHFSFKSELDAYKFFDREVFKMELDHKDATFVLNTLFKSNRFESKTISFKDYKITLTATKED